jgi:hypothetical protein
MRSWAGWLRGHSSVGPAFQCWTHLCRDKQIRRTCLLVKYNYHTIEICYRFKQISDCHVTQFILRCLTIACSYEAQTFVMFTKADHWTLFRASWVQYTRNIYHKKTLILSYWICLHFLFLRFPTKSLLHLTPFVHVSVLSYILGDVTRFWHHKRRTLL